MTDRDAAIRTYQLESICRWHYSSHGLSLCWMGHQTLDPAPVSAALKPPTGTVWLWLLLTLVWISANSSLAIESVATGAIIAAVLALFFSSKSEFWQSAQLNPERLYHFILYTGVFIVELVRANINMLRHVYSPRISIAPGIVEIKTRLKSPIGRLALANSIALTPGSLVIDMKGDTLVVHWLVVRTTDPDTAASMISLPFERHLEKTFD